VMADPDHQFIAVETYDPQRPSIYAQETLDAMEQKAFADKNPAVLLSVSLRRPIARIQLATRIARIKCVMLRAAYTLYIWSWQKLARLPLTCACTFCGLPTGRWCDSPLFTGEGFCGKAVCTECDSFYHGCRLHYTGTRAFDLDASSDLAHRDLHI